MDVLDVHKAHNAVNSIIILHDCVAVECEDDRCGVRKTSRFDDNGIELFSSTGKHAEGANKVPTH